MFRSEFLEALQRKVVVFDGAMGTSIQNRRPTVEDFGGVQFEGLNDHLVLTRPDMIEEIHASFLEAGADVLETNTFGGSRLKLGEYGIADKVYELNFAAAKLARRVADRFATPERPRFVVGSMGPTGMLPSSTDPELSKITFKELKDIFKEQARPLVEGGADALIVETCQDLLEVKAAVVGIREFFAENDNRVPIIVTVSLDTQGKMLLGTDIGAVLATLEPLRIDALGLNCSTGPDYMKDPVRYLSEWSPLPIIVVPNAGLPLNEGGRAVYPMRPRPMAEILREFVSEFGVQMIGGCCGTTPEHIKQFADAVAGLQPKRRFPKYSHSFPLPAASGMTAVSLVQDQTVMMIGERCNTQGSKAVKELMLADKYDELKNIAQDQVDFGAHALDVCVALTEREDEPEQMRQVVRRLASWTHLPIVIDSTEANVIELALENYPGSAIVNSINLEEGRKRIDAVMPLVMRHGASVIALTIDNEVGGMAKTVEQKLQVAKKIYRICVDEYGLDPRRLLFDCLTFTLATGEAEFRDSAVQTLDAIARVKKELEGAVTTLGLSNVSFGLKPAQRRVINSVFLYHAYKAGLDTAIVNPAHIVPYADIPEEPRKLAEDLVFNRSDDALARFLAFFDANIGFGAATGPGKADPTEGMTAEEAVHWKIVHRKPEDIEPLLDDVMTRKSPVETLNTVLLPAMKEVGDKFGAGELILPFVLQSAEAMKKAVAHVEKFLERADGATKGIMVLATVYGDVHDIGKNLVRTIVGNNGYTIHDLGKQVPAQTIVNAAREKKADAVGLSALLVSTSSQMPVVVKELHKAGLDIPVIIGGAAINRSFGRRTCFLDKEKRELYGPGVFYAKDAFEGLDIIERLVDPAQRARFVLKNAEEAVHSLEIAERAAAEKTGNGSAAPVAERSKTRFLPKEELPEPPFLGVRTLEEIPIEEVWACMDLNTLYRLHWGGKNKSGAEWERLVKEEYEPRLRDLTKESEREGYMAPRAVVGVFPCYAEGDTVALLDPEEGTRVVERFSFPRQQGRDHLCLADYFAPKEAPYRDYICLQVVTVGDRASVLTEEWSKKGDYARGYFLHGLAMEAAEGLAEYAHRHLLKRMGLRPGRGKRYSWGYPAIPDLSDHGKLFKLLEVTERIGIELTEAWQLVPEQSTAAVVVHHPDATYYNV
jgi:5-methyltetrahydrofolate--homocysteine methyltransferase